LFERKSVVEFAVTDEIDMDEVELGLIDYGLDELEINEGLPTPTEILPTSVI